MKTAYNVTLQRGFFSEFLIFLNQYKSDSTQIRYFAQNTIWFLFKSDNEKVCFSKFHK